MSKHPSLKDFADAAALVIIGSWYSSVLLSPLCKIGSHCAVHLISRARENIYCFAKQNKGTGGRGGVACWTFRVHVMAMDDGLRWGAPFPEEMGNRFNSKIGRTAFSTAFVSAISVRNGPANYTTAH